MMLRTGMFVGLGLLLSIRCSAATDPRCLNHLGGAFADVECYNGLSNKLKTANGKLTKEIESLIPAGNKYRRILQSYQSAQDESAKYCALARSALTGWADGESTQNPRYYYYDVAYYQCVYENLLHQNWFLRQVLHNATQS